MFWAFDRLWCCIANKHTPLAHRSAAAQPVESASPTKAEEDYRTFKRRIERRVWLDHVKGFYYDAHEAERTELSARREG